MAPERPILPTPSPVDPTPGPEVPTDLSHTVEPSDTPSPTVDGGEGSDDANVAGGTGKDVIEQELLILVLGVILVAGFVGVCCVFVAARRRRRKEQESHGGDGGGAADGVATA